MSIFFFPLAIILILLSAPPAHRSPAVKNSGMQKIHQMVLRGEDEFGLVSACSQTSTEEKRVLSPPRLRPGSHHIRNKS